MFCLFFFFFSVIHSLDFIFFEVFVDANRSLFRLGPALSPPLRSNEPVPVCSHQDLRERQQKQEAALEKLRSIKEEKRQELMRKKELEEEKRREEEARR